MYQYTTSLQSRLPAGQSPLAGLQSPYQYQDPHDDLMRSRSLENAAMLNAEAEKANTDYSLAQQNAENAIISQGLQMLAKDAGSQRDYDTSRLQSMYGISNQLLRGLYG